MFRKEWGQETRTCKQAACFRQTHTLHYVLSVAAFPAQQQSVVVTAIWPISLRYLYLVLSIYSAWLNVLNTVGFQEMCYLLMKTACWLVCSISITS